LNNPVIVTNNSLIRLKIDSGFVSWAAIKSEDGKADLHVFIKPKSRSIDLYPPSEDADKTRIEYILYKGVDGGEYNSESISSVVKSDNKAIIKEIKTTGIHSSIYVEKDLGLASVNISAQQPTGVLIFILSFFSFITIVILISSKNAALHVFSVFLFAFVLSASDIYSHENSTSYFYQYLDMERE
jgi:hypothetical protein